MKSILFFLFFASPAFAFTFRDLLRENEARLIADGIDPMADSADGDEDEPKRRVRRVKGVTAKEEEEEGLRRRDLKSKGSKSGGCETIRVFTRQRDYTKNGDLIGKYGESIDNVKLYNAKTHKAIATITETVLDTGKDCTAQGALNFGAKANGKTRDQIMYQGTCSGGLTNAVTGGTGVFTSATGVMKYLESKTQKLFFELYVCESA
jgi:hypothetical protein